MRTAGAPALLIALLASGCSLFATERWEKTRREVIEPINSSLHRHLPRDLKARDMDAVMAVYATESGTGLGWESAAPVADGFRETRIRWSGPPTTEAIRARYERLLARFETIDKAEVRIHRIHWDQRTDLGYPADVHLIVRGLGPDGAHQRLDQWNRTWIDLRAPAGAAPNAAKTWRITGEEVVSRELVTAAQPQFEVATEAAGIADTHDTENSPPFRLLGDIGVSSGAAVADVDGDGYEDLALLSSSRVVLYRNDADGTFTDATAASGLAEPLDIAGTGLVFFDADNDGDPDLWLSGVRGERFYRNQGGGEFTDATTAAHLTPSTWASMPVVADYDRDGDLDVFVVRMGDHEKTAPTPNWDAHNGVPSTLYRNDGDGTFTDVTEQAHIAENGWAFAGAWGDYDGDGYPDLYVGNEFGTNSLWHNDRDGTFTNLAMQTGALDRGAAMGVAWGDYDGDGHLDLFVSNMYANSRWALFHPDFPSPVPWYLEWVPRADIDKVTDELSRGSTLLHNNGDGTFTDVSAQAGIRDTQWGWGAEFLDYDNDGRLDIYAANGFISGPVLDDV